MRVLWGVRGNAYLPRATITDPDFTGCFTAINPGATVGTTGRGDNYIRLAGDLLPGDPADRAVIGHHVLLALLPDWLMPMTEHPLWYMSFATELGFLGALVVNAETLREAVTVSHLTGLNPGGEARIVGPLLPEWISHKWRYRLLTREEAETIPDPFGESSEATTHVINPPV